MPTGDLTPTVNEGTNTVETVSITDPDNDDVNSCILGGADASDFYCLISQISFLVLLLGARLRIISATTDNIYLVTVTISDSFNTGATLRVPGVRSRCE